jgi:hypothetical protein
MSTLESALRDLIAAVVREEITQALAAIGHVNNAHLPVRPQYETTQQLAERIGLAVVTLETWRRAGEGPPHMRVGRRVLYERAAIEAWLASTRGVRCEPVRAAATIHPVGLATDEVMGLRGRAKLSDRPDVLRILARALISPATGRVSSRFRPSVTTAHTRVDLRGARARNVLVLDDGGRVVIGCRH